MSNYEEDVLIQIGMERAAVICDNLAKEFDKNEEYFLDAVARAKTNAAKRCAASIRANDWRIKL